MPFSSHNLLIQILVSFFVGIQYTEYLLVHLSKTLIQVSWLSIPYQRHLEVIPSFTLPTCSIKLCSLCVSGCWIDVLGHLGTDANWVHPRGSTARQVHEAKMSCRLPLTIFGISVYKFKIADWTANGVHGTEKINYLIRSSDNWLRNLDVHHPDHVFFKSHYIPEKKQVNGW